VQVDALTQHPEVVTAKQVQVNKHDHLTAHLVGGGVAELVSAWNIPCQCQPTVYG
jgi:L-lactate permease